MGRLRHLLDSQPLVRVMEVHSGLTGLIVDRTRVGEGEDAREFDAMWLSSLTDLRSR